MIMLLLCKDFYGKDVVINTVGVFPKHEVLMFSFGHTYPLKKGVWEK